MSTETIDPRDPRAAGGTHAAGFVRSGKVRDLFEIGDRLLLVASDRLSAFDVVLPTLIPDKGRVLTGISRFWFDQTTDIIPNEDDRNVIAMFEGQSAPQPPPPATSTERFPPGCDVGHVLQ